MASSDVAEQLAELCGRSKRLKIETAEEPATLRSRRNNGEGRSVRRWTLDEAKESRGERERVSEDLLNFLIRSEVATKVFFFSTRGGKVCRVLNS